MSTAATVQPPADGAPLPQIDPAVTSDVIVGFIRSQLAQTGFERLVVGLSGGVDSATVAYLAARAIGPGNLLAVRMPYRTSSPDSETDAMRVVQALGCQTERVEITLMVDPMLALLPDTTGRDLPVRRGNVMARQRMIVLYDRSAAFDGLVAGTSNKTEALLGYGTLFGDMACAIAPIGDLYKTQLRAVAEHLGRPAADRGQTAIGRPLARPDRRGGAGAPVRGPGPGAVRARGPALERRAMRGRRSRCRPRGVGGGPRRAHGVQAPDAAGGQGEPSYAWHRSPLSATPSWIAPHVVSHAGPAEPAGPALPGKARRTGR